MQYAIEDLNPVKKKITVTVPAAETGKAVDEAVSSFRSSLKLDGFRRGKVPADLVMKRFNREVIQQATDRLVQGNIREIMENNAFDIVSRMDYDGGLLERGSDFTYNLVFEVMPEFDLPHYEDLEIEQEEVVADESAIDAALLNMRQRRARISPLQEDRPAKDGDTVILDFAALDDAGAALADFKAENFLHTLGEGIDFPDFENLVKGLAPGEEKEEPLTFPENFVNSGLAGRTVRTRVKLKKLVEKILPAEDDAFAKEAGNFESLAKMRESLREAFLRGREDTNKAKAQKRLLDKLLEQAEFTVPEAMIESQTAAVRRELFNVLKEYGPVSNDALKAVEGDVRREAEKRAKARAFLLTVAKKQGLTVSRQDIDVYLHRLARGSGQEFKTLREYYVRNNLLSGLEEVLLADKGMEEVYSKARIVLVPPAPEAGETAPAGTDDHDGAQSRTAPDEALPAAAEETDANPAS